MVKNILIIEDDQFLIELLSKKFSSEGFKVFEAMNGKEGLEKIQEVKPDLILLDLLLPNIDGLNVDGFNVLSKTKENSATSSIPIIILSNLGQQEEIQRGLKLGATDYLVKSQFTSDEIIKKVKKVLDEK